MGSNVKALLLVKAKTKHAIRGFSKVRLAETLLWSQMDDRRTDTHTQSCMGCVGEPGG